MLDNVFMQVLDMTKAASLVILAVILIRLLLKKAPKVYSYALWTVALLRLLCPVSIEAPVSVMPQIQPVSEGYTLAAQPITFAGATQAAYHAIEDISNGVPNVQQIQIPETDTQVTANWWEVWVLFGKYVWLAGIALMLLYSAVCLIRLKLRIREAVPLRDNIFLADRIDSPFVMGLFRPKIYLPSSLSENEQDYIIAHEQHHIRRLDHVVKLIAFGALCVHWFNPLVWLAFVLSGKDMEMSCDEAVIKKLGEEIRADYSASLLSLSTGHRIIAGTPLAFGEGDTGSRIRNLAKWKKPAIWVSVIAVIAVIIAGVVLMIDPAENEPQTETTGPQTETTETPIQSTPTAEPEPGTVYVSYECLYMNPLSSYLNGADSGSRYHINTDSFTIENRMYGFSNEFENIRWEWIPYHESGKELDELFENSQFYQFGPLEQDVLYQPISNDYFLIQKDGTLLIYEVRSVNKRGRQIWSIYSLVPESYMGSAQWMFHPTSSADLPLFRFEFGIDCTDISAVCTQSNVSIYLDPDLGDNQAISWSPVNDNGEIVTDAKISFTLLNGDMPVSNGAIYITSEPTGNLGGYLYTARIVGTGLHIEQKPDNAGAIISNASTSDPIPGAVYVSYECLYMNPTVSASYSGYDSGCRYHVGEDSFSIETRNDKTTTIENINWKWESLPYSDEELNGLFQYFDEPFTERTQVIENIFRDVLYQRLSDDYFLMRKDGMLLLVELDNGTTLWSVYSLVSEIYMGFAQWTISYYPSWTAYHQFPFEFDIDCTELYLRCYNGSLSELDPTDENSYVVDLSAGNTVNWVPVMEDGEFATTAYITFIAYHDNGQFSEGTIYITGEADGNSSCTYTARIVGTGLQIAQNADGTGGVITLLTDQSV